MNKPNTLLVGIALITVLASGIISSTEFASSQNSIHDSGLVYGHITLVQKDEFGNIINYVQTDNLVVDQGLDTAGDLVFPDINLNGNSTDNKFEWIGIGSGNTAASATDTQEETLISGCVRLDDTTVTGTSAVSGEITATVSVQFSGAQCANTSISEAVLTNSGSGASAGAGELLARQTFTDINLGSGDTLTITWDITIT